jgi:hypothetical protein
MYALKSVSARLSDASTPLMRQNSLIDSFIVPVYKVLTGVAAPVIRHF